MNAGRRQEAATDRGNRAETSPRTALAAMLAVQMLATATLVAASVLAPAVAPQLGVAPSRIGSYIALAYFSAMLAGLIAGQGVARWGALPLSQAALGSAAAGALLAAAGPAQTLLAAAVLIGIGYGLVNPAAAAVLTHHAPAHARGLHFSIKQTGVPLGVALAGVAMPAALALLGWRMAAAALALACALMALVLWPLNPRLEPPRAKAQREATGAALAGRAVHDAAPGDRPGRIRATLTVLGEIWRDPPLRRLALASLAYAVTQQAYVTFTVPLLNLRLGWTLAAAAGVLAASQVLASAARIGLGALADRVAPSRVLALLGVAMGASCVALALLAPGTPAIVVGAAALACAATAMGWNGVFFAAMAQQVPQAAMARIAGGTQFFTFGGGMLGPLAFGEALRAGAGYPLAFAATAVLPWAAAIALGRAEMVRRR